MALICVFDASTGDIWTNGIYDGGTLIQIPTLYTQITTHTHNSPKPDLDTHSEAYTALPMKSTGGTHYACRVSTTASSSGAVYAQCYGHVSAGRSHSHTADSLIVAAPTAGHSYSPQYSYIKVDHSGGHVTCHKICNVGGASCYDPYVLFGLHDDHTHTISCPSGDPFNSYTFPPIPAAAGYNANYKYFHVGTDNTGADAVWALCQTHGNDASSEHNHTLGSISLGAHSHTMAGGAGSGLVFKVNHATGYVYVYGNINGVGLVELYNDAYSHSHSGGASECGTYGATQSQVFKSDDDSYSFFEVSGSATWYEMEVYAAAHSHNVTF